MKHKFSAAIVFLMVALVSATGFAAETLKLDPAHSTVLFRAGHMNIGYVYGMFLKSDATVVYDEADPSKTTIEWTVNADSVFTNNQKRDGHLKSPDFLDAKQFPKISFKSKKVEKVEKVSGNTMRVTGDLTLHGTTREITFLTEMTGSGKGEKGETRRGFFASFDINRSDYGIKALPEAASERIHMVITFEGVTE